MTVGEFQKEMCSISDKMEAMLSGAGGEEFPQTIARTLTLLVAATESILIHLEGQK